MPGTYDDIPIAPDPLLNQVMPRESGGKNLPPTANYDYPHSHASGVLQFQPQTWRQTAKETGLGQKYGEAYQAPPDVQIANGKYLEKKYGLNSPYTWAASAPRGGYKEAQKGSYDDIPLEKPTGKGAYDDIPVQTSKPQMGSSLPPQVAQGTSNDQLRRDLNLPSIGQIRSEGYDPEIAARIKQLPPQTLAAMMRDPKNPMWVRVIGGTMGAVADMVPNLPELAKRVGAETAAHVATPETAGDVGQLALGTGLNSPALAIKSPAVKMADGRIVEGPNHGAIESAGTTGEPGFTTGQGHFVNREEGAGIAKAAQQAPADVQSLHSEDLRPQSAGAAATNQAVLTAYKAVPPVPTKVFINSTDDSFFRVRQAATADKAQFDNFVKTLPPELKDAGLQERFYNHMEGDAPLSAEDQALYDRYVKPLKNEEKDLFDEIKKFSPDIAKEFDPTYVHRMVKGKSREFDPWMGEVGDAAADPVGGYRSRSTSSLKDRVYYVIENEKGVRKVVAITDHGTMVLNKGQPATPLSRYQGEATKPGDSFSINGDKWSVKQAKTSEIEANTNLKYYKNAMASTVKNVAQLRAVARSLAEINRLKQTPEWAAYTAPLDKRPPGWQSVDFPPFRDRWFEPRFAAVINDFWASKKYALGEKMAAINRISVGSLFWSPIPHALNQGAHWASARGWDWVTPQGLRSLMVDSAKAIREVVTQGPEYQRMLREGSGMIYGSIANEQFYRSILKTLGESVKREPWKWDPIARAMGVGPSDLVRMLYGVSSRALWSISDMMMMQRVFELERKGMSTRDAIADAEKHIPNYRIPPQVLGSRAFAQLLKDPSLTTFSRYHYGMFKSYGHMARDLAVGTGEERFKAMGNVFATAALIAIVGPTINRGIQKITGDKDLEMGPRGSTTIPVNLWDAWYGKPIEQVIQSSITMAPIPKLALEEFFNLDFFTGRHIREPADQEQHRFGRTVAQTAEHVAQGTISPYGTAAQVGEKKGLKGVLEGEAKQGLGLRKPFKPYHGKVGGYGTLAQQANYRRTHPRGPIEQLEKRAEDWLKESVQ